MLIDSLIQIFSTSRSVDTKTKASKTLFLGCKENYSSSATHSVIFRFFICIICCRLIKHKCLLGLYTAFDAVVKIVLPVRMFSYKLRIVLQQRKRFCNCQRQFVCGAITVCPACNLRRGKQKHGAAFSHDFAESRVPDGQCDHIRRNFATLAKF